MVARKGLQDFLVLETTGTEAEDNHQFAATERLLARHGVTSFHLDFSQVPSLGDLFKKLQEQARQGTDVVYLSGGSNWLKQRESFNTGTASRTDLLNVQRDNLFKIPVKVMLSLPPQAISDFADTALDLWAWRGGVYNLGPKNALPATGKKHAASSLNGISLIEQ